jgi:hypothetical protein
VNIHAVYAALSRPFRRRRMAQFCRHFAVTDATTIIDIGGSPSIWQFLQSRPQILLVNPDSRYDAPDLPRNIRFMVGDGRLLESVNDVAYDIAFSNSVIEHVVGRADREAFAAEVRRVGRSYYVQTPCPRFPIEPHLLAPFVHWLPLGVQQAIIRRGTPWGWIAKPSPSEVGAFLDDTRLLSYEEFRGLFPDATIHRERFLGVTKSYIAVCYSPGLPGTAEQAVRPNQDTMAFSKECTKQADGPSTHDDRPAPWRTAQLRSAASRVG